jgi:hypothetical protein
MVLRRYYWLCVKDDITHFVKVWMDAEWIEFSYQNQGGFLQLLFIMPRLWQNMWRNLITSFSELQDYNAIMVMVKRFAKFAHMMRIVGTAAALETA